MWGGVEGMGGEGGVGWGVVKGGWLMGGSGGGSQSGSLSVYSVLFLFIMF